MPRVNNRAVEGRDSKITRGYTPTENISAAITIVSPPASCGLISCAPTTQLARVQRTCIELATGLQRAYNFALPAPFQRVKVKHEFGRHTEAAAGS